MQGLVKKGIKVIMAVRNIQKGEEAKNEIIRPLQFRSMLEV